MDALRATSGVLQQQADEDHTAAVNEAAHGADSAPGEHKLGAAVHLAE